MDYITKNIDETKQFAARLASKLKGGEVLCFYGDLGAGKTAFIAGIVNYFLPEKRVLSPTFTIVRHYYPHKDEIKEILHVDLYRLLDASEINGLGLSEFMHKPGFIIAFEWAERLGKLLPEKRTDVHIDILSEIERRFRINGNEINK